MEDYKEVLPTVEEIARQISPTIENREFSSDLIRGLFEGADKFDNVDTFLQTKTAGRFVEKRFNDKDLDFINAQTHLMYWPMRNYCDTLTHIRTILKIFHSCDETDYNKRDRLANDARGSLMFLNQNLAKSIRLTLLAFGLQDDHAAVINHLHILADRCKPEDKHSTQLLDIIGKGYTYVD